MPTASVQPNRATIAEQSAVEDPVDTAESAGAPAGRNIQLPCRQDPDLWFAENPQDLERAKTQCAECPIKAECLAGALARGEPWGVWGGEIFEAGAVVRRKRGRGRPRKHPRPEEPAGTANAAPASRESARYGWENVA